MKTWGAECRSRFISYALIERFSPPNLGDVRGEYGAKFPQGISTMKEQY